MTGVISPSNKKVNPNRVLSADSGMLNKGSNLTRHLSQLSLVDNLRGVMSPEMTSPEVTGSQSPEPEVMNRNRK
jgi:hypothetical protein